MIQNCFTAVFVCQTSNLLLRANYYGNEFIIICINYNTMYLFNKINKIKLSRLKPTNRISYHGVHITFIPSIICV